MNAQQKAVALLLQLLAARPARRKELLKEQHSFVAVIRHEERIVAHGEFFMEGDVPFHEVVETTQGVCFRNAMTGAAAFVPFLPSAAFVPAAVPAPAAALAPVAPSAPAPAAAPVVVTTRSRRVSFGEELTFWNSDFSKKLEFIAPSSGAVIEELLDNGTVQITFVGATRQTWTI